MKALEVILYTLGYICMVAAPFALFLLLLAIPDRADYVGGVYSPPGPEPPWYFTLPLVATIVCGVVFGMLLSEREREERKERKRLKKQRRKHGNGSGV